MKLNLIQAFTLFPLLILSRDPFVWPEKDNSPSNTTIATLEPHYRLVGISYHRAIKQYTALITEGETLLHIQLNDLLPNKMRVKSITSDAVELSDNAQQVLISW